MEYQVRGGSHQPRAGAKNIRTILSVAVISTDHWAPLVTRDDALPVCWLPGPAGLHGLRGRPGYWPGRPPVLGCPGLLDGSQEVVSL
jgi:hypothetical protein